LPGSTVTSTLSGFPAGFTASYNSAENRVYVTGTPSFDANDSSPYSGSVTISNGTDSVVVNTTITVAEAGSLSVVNNLPTTGTEGVAYSGSIDVTNLLTGSTVTSTLSGFPAGFTASYNSAENRVYVTGTPSFDANDSSPYSGSVTISNGTDSVVVNVSLAIANVNRPLECTTTAPVFPTLVGNTSPITGNIFSDTGCIDPDGNTATVQNPQTFIGTHGTYQIVANGDYTVNFNPGADGNDVFTGITLQDGDGDTRAVSHTFNGIDTQDLSSTSDTISLITFNQPYSVTVTLDDDDFIQSNLSFELIDIIGGGVSGSSSVSITGISGSTITLLVNTGPKVYPTNNPVQIRGTYTDNAGNSNTEFVGNVQFLN
ncbi:hypothetical protein MK079_05075, partial [Candidatus Gracilibacteria bacterium]|nr:hypothetical protein [Candidatus Gracilibacteria bacterium]